MLDRLVIGHLNAEKTLERIHISVRTAPLGFAVGDRVELRPPTPPTMPGTIDFESKAFFERIGAFGFAVVPIRPAKKTDERPLVTAEILLNRVRQAINQRIDAVLDVRAAAIAKALMTGDRTSILESDFAAMRDSGLAHLIAISGLNVSFMAGLVFFAIRISLAVVPPIALRLAIKKWSALAGIPAVAAYLAITGATVPTQRAFLMVTVVFIAILI